MVRPMETDARAAARRYYSASRRSLQADMAALAANPGGVVLFSPALVALMRQVHHREPQSWELLEEPPSAQADAWYVHLMVGDLAWARRLARKLPPMRWLCFQRGVRSPRPHVWPWHRLLS